MFEKKRCISCNINSKFYIYPFLLPIACTFTHFFQKIMFDNSFPVKSYKMLKYNFPYLFYYFLPKLLSFIIIHIIKYKTKRENTKGDNIQLRRYHFFIKNENKKQIFLIIFIISFFEVLFKTGDTILIYLQKINKIHYLIEKRTGFIISVPFFSYIMLYKKLYKHHIIALILGLIGAFIINFCRFPLDFSFIDEYLYHLLNIFFSFLFAFSLVLIKFLLIHYFISPYIFLFYDGLFCIIILIFFILFEYPIIIKINDTNDKINVGEENENYFKNNFFGIFTVLIGQNPIFYLGFFISFISSLFYFIFNILTIYHFSPYLNVLTDFLTPYFYNLLNFIFLENDKTDKNIKRYIFEFIGYSITIFGALILNEIIIFNCFGLNENTFKKISYRGDLDFTIGLNSGPDETFTEINTENEAEGEASSN